ncbi:hypothetical protein V475_13765 [Sphingobium baderi LL03]|jgi:hypothetical protein|uniref:Uncharacterized protein n=1 Tax=Sphingobium baderi LL03 TaxID=1114964 RepID=T0GEU1_9SPHN|nr:hypothetical protein L485_16670 [Sphingobium baderi LL03]KMS61572.1 hypothetical protein V475_13765 [Sphingobium baderi LL03]
MTATEGKSRTASEMLAAYDWLALHVQHVCQH